MLDRNGMELDTILAWHRAVRVPILLGLALLAFVYWLTRRKSCKPANLAFRVHNDSKFDHKPDEVDAEFLQSIERNLDGFRDAANAGYAEDGRGAILAVIKSGGELEAYYVTEKMVTGMQFEGLDLQVLLGKVRSYDPLSQFVVAITDKIYARCYKLRPADICEFNPKLSSISAN
jgi:hypothetical protein